MGNGGAKLAGLEEAPQTIAQSVEGILKEVRIESLLRSQQTALANLKQVNDAEKEESTKFAAFDHNPLPWQIVFAKYLHPKILELAEKYDVVTLTQQDTNRVFSWNSETRLFKNTQPHTRTSLCSTNTLEINDKENLKAQVGFETAHGFNGQEPK